MKERFEPPLERLSSNDREIVSQPEIQGMILGLKPAAFEDWHGEIQNLDAVKEYMISLGVDALVLQHLIVNRTALAARIAEEPELAKEAGWQEGKTLDDFAKGYFNMPNGQPNDALRGFLVGFPASAIHGFQRKEALRKRGVPCRVKAFFNANEEKTITDVIKDDEGKAILEEMHTAYKNLPKQKWEHGPDRPTPENEDMLLKQYRKQIGDLYRKYWKLSNEEVEDLLYLRTVTIVMANGKTSHEFFVFGKDAHKAPDVLALQERAQKSPK